MQQLLDHWEGVGMKRKLIRERTAEGYIDVAFAILILFTFMASLMLLFPIFTAKMDLDQTAKYMARTVELYGQADDATLDSVTEDGDFLAPDTVKVDTEWLDAAEKTIQIKTRFTVTLTKTVPITILRPALGDPVVIHIQIAASADGISEVYWK